MAKYDLTNEFAKHYNVHLFLPLLEFFSVQDVPLYSDGVQSAKFDMLKKTNMVDYALEVGGDDIDDEVREELSDKRAMVFAQLRSLKAETDPIFQIFGNDEVHEQVQQSRDHTSLVAYLEKNHGYRSEMLDVCYKFARFKYECGQYEEASLPLYLFRSLLPQTDRRHVSSLWGKLACEILTHKWEEALESLNHLKELLDSGVLNASPLLALEQRTCLIHWSLYVFFNHPKGRELIIEMLLYQTQYLNAIQTTCPHILRYLATAVVINKKRWNPAIKDLVKVIQQEAYKYTDPITDLLTSLHVDFNFAKAHEKLQLCSDVLENDFFLVACKDDFIANARLMIFELYCRTHQCIRIDMLAEKLNMSVDEAEHWIVDLIRDSKLDAKIDSQAGHVIMGTQAVSPYQQFVEKMNGISLRTQALAANFERKVNSSSSSDTPYRPY